MQNWLIYIAVALIFFLAITLPILARPDLVPDENEDIRKKLYTMERKITRLENRLAKYQRIQTNTRQLQKKISPPANPLSHLLKLSPKQEKYIMRAIAAYNKQTSQEHLWQVLDTREQIMSILTPIQREKYSNYLLHSPNGF